MSVIAWIFIGLVAGFLANRVAGTPGGLFRNIAIGLVGSIIGGFLAQRLGVTVRPDFWGELLTATVGAVILLFLWQLIKRA